MSNEAKHLKSLMNALLAGDANLRDEWFQAALVEQPWAKPPALVPDDWPDKRHDKSGS
jgi:hypothetical protein